MDDWVVLSIFAKENFRFKARNVQMKEPNEPIINTSTVEIRMFPNPTRGETSPPKVKPKAPNKAEAIPALDRALSIANVLEAVNVKPNMRSKPMSKVSYTQKLQLE